MGKDDGLNGVGKDGEVDKGRIEEDGRGWKRIEEDGGGWKRMEEDRRGWKNVRMTQAKKGNVITQTKANATTMRTLTESW